MVTIKDTVRRLNTVHFRIGIVEAENSRDTTTNDGTLFSSMQLELRIGHGKIDAVGVSSLHAELS